MAIGAPCDQFWSIGGSRMVRLNDDFRDFRCLPLEGEIECFPFQTHNSSKPMKSRKNRFLAFSVLSLSLLQSAQAATGTWSGGVGDTWDTTATNWTGVTDTPWDGTNGPNNTAVFNLAALLAPVSGTVFTNGITFSTGGTINPGGIITLGGTSPTLSAATAVTGTIKSNLVGSSGFTKAGLGTILVNNSTANSLTGDIIINAGQLTIQPAANVAAIATTANLIMNGSSLALLGGGTGVATTRSQTFSGTIFSAGHSAASLNKNTGDATNPATLNFGNITRNVGGTVTLSYTGATTTDRSIQGTSTGWGGGATIHDNGAVYATTNGTVVTSTAVVPRFSNDWAAYNGTAVVAATYTASTATTLSGNANVALGIDTTLAANSNITSLRFAQAQTRTITATGFALTTGGVLVSSGVGNFTQTITGGTLSSAATVANKDLVVIQNNTANDLIIASQIINASAGATGLTKSGAGRLSLTSNSNNYTGETRINEGILRIGAGGGTGVVSASSSIVNNAALQFDRSVALVQGTHFSSTISGTGSLSVQRTTNVTLNSANNTFSGGVTIPTDGVLKLSHGAALGSGSLTIGNGNGTAVHVARLELTNNINVPNAIALNGRVTSTSDGIRNVSGNNTLAGTITQFPGGGLGFIQSDSGLLTLGTSGSTAITADSTVTSGRTVVLRGAGNGNVTGKIVDNTVTKSMAVTKEGTGTWTLSDTNTYTGTTIVNQGTLTVDTAGTLGATTGSLVVGNNNTTADATNTVLNLSTTADTVKGSLSGAILTPLTGINSATINTGGSGRNFTVNQTVAGTFAGVIAGAGDFTLGGLSTNTLTLTGLNTYSGNTTVNAGILSVATDDVFADTSTVSLAAASSLDLSHSGIDTVNKLFINGIEQANGLYTFGTGQLNVVGATVSTPFQTWATAKGLTGAPGFENGPTDDPDKDGATNIAEFAFNGNPLSGSDNGQIYVLTADSDADSPDTDKELILTLAVRKTTPAFTAGAPATAPLTDGVNYSIHGSTDLISFGITVTPVGFVDPGVSLSDATNYEYRSFSLSGSNGLSGKGFIRAKAEAP
jgi:autotransporter-associated beta strand protein